MTARLLAVAALLFLVGCGSGVNILPEPFTRERADGKIPVHAELIRKQERAVLDGMPEKEAEVARWQAIETDYNECRLSSARSKKAEAEEVFAVCMSKKGYVYMYPIDAEQFHNDIANELWAAKAAAERAVEERRLAAEKKAEEERIAAEKEAEERRLAAEKKAEEERIAAEEAEKKRQIKEQQKRNDEGLAAAAESGDADEARRFLAAGANPDAPSLISKEMAENFKGLADALEKDVSPERREGAIMPARVLRRAAWRGHVDVVKVLLDAGANPDGLPNDEHIPLVVAAQDGHAVIVKMLLDAGANPNHAAPKGKFDSSQYFAIEAAAQSSGRSKIVKMLLDAGANIEDALHSAANNRTDDAIEVVNMLLAAGANVNKRGWHDNRTPLHNAADWAVVEVVKILLAAGADVNVRNRSKNTYGGLKIGALIVPFYDEETPLHKAARGYVPDDSIKERKRIISERIDVIKMLLAAGADIHAFDERGNTALHDAADEGYYEIVQFLLDKGASPTAYNKEGKTPCQTAANSWKWRKDQHEVGFLNETIKILRQSGANRCSRWE